MHRYTDEDFRKALFYRWIIWGILIISYIIVHFHRQSMGVVKDNLVDDYAMSATTFANIGSMYFYVYMLMQIPSGILADSLGPRKTVTIGTLLSGIGAIIFSLAPNVFWLYTGRLFVGLGVSVVFIAILKIQAQWFRSSEFGTMSGLTSFFGNIGGICAQTPLAIMISLFTWRASFTIIGVFSLVVALFCFVLVRNSPEDMGFPPIHKTATEVQESNSFSRLLRALLIVIKNPGTWVAFFLFAGFHGSFISIGSIWGVSYLVDVYGLTKVSAANYITVIIVGVAFGGVSIGKFSDYMGKRKLPMVSFGITNVLCWFIILIVFSGKPPVGLLSPLLFILGFSYTSYILSWAYAKEINPDRMSGLSTSVVNVGGFVGGGLLPPVLGMIMDSYSAVLPATQLYQRAFMCCLAASLLGLIATLLVKETNCKNIYIGKTPST